MIDSLLWILILILIKQMTQLIFTEHNILIIRRLFQRKI